MYVLTMNNGPQWDCSVQDTSAWCTVRYATASAYTLCPELTVKGSRCVLFANFCNVKWDCVL